MLQGFNHLTLAVSNVEISFKFYRDFLGFKPEAIWDHGAYLSLGDLWLCLSLDNVRQEKDYTHYAFSIAEANFPLFHQKLKTAGILEWKENKSEGESIYFLDPDGHQLEVHCGNLQTRLKSCLKDPYPNMVLF